jgi:hypothetical protein
MVELVDSDHVGAAPGTRPELIDKASGYVNAGSYTISELLPPYIRIRVFGVCNRQQPFEDEVGCGDGAGVSSEV